MVTPQEVQKAEETLTKFLAVFRAAGVMQESIETIKAAVNGYAAIQAETRKAEENLAAMNAALATARHELAEARIEKERLDQAVGAIKLQLKGMKL